VQKNELDKIQTILECSNIGTWEWNVQTGEGIFNEAWARIVGYELKELSPTNLETWTNLAHPDDLIESKRLLNRHFSGEDEYYDLECRMKHKEGHWIWVHDRGKVVSWTKDGKPLLMLGSHEDITERKQTEEALQDSEEKFRALFEKGPIGVAYHKMIYDENGKHIDYFFLDANESYLKLTGVDPRGKLVTEAFPGIELDPFDWIGTFGKVADTGEEIRFEQYLQPNDRWYDCVGYQVKPGHFVAAFMEITERKKAEQILAEEKERLAVTLRSIGDGVITTDIHGQVMIMNKVAEELTGWSQEDACGKNLNQVFALRDIVTGKPYTAPVSELLESGNTIQIGQKILKNSGGGEDHIISDSGAPIKNKDGDTIGMVLVFRDVTEKQRFLEISQNTQKLESLGVLAGGIAHDFNNLLGGIYGYIELARDESNCEAVSEYLASTIKTLDRARALTGQLLTFSRGGAPVAKVQSLFPFVEETANFILSGSEVVAKYQVDQDLWECNFDQNQMGQVIDNLVINAQQAMQGNGVVTITAKNCKIASVEHPTLKDGDYVKLSVQDTGSGIPKEIISRVFDPFFTTKDTGHGLGLATCFSIVTQHNGTIEVESKPGFGATFTLYFPASKETAKQASSVKKSHQGEGTILVMDDEVYMREILTAMLGSFGYSVVATENGQEVLDYLEQNKDQSHLAAMIFDLTVPGKMGGKETIAHVRKTLAELPIFVASGYADDSEMKSPKKFGFTASISKPFRKVELGEMLDRWC